MYNILIWRTHINQNFDFFAIAFSALFLSLPFVFHLLSGCRKKLGVNYGQSLEMGPWWIIVIIGHFTTIFASKLITLFFNLLRVYIRMPSISKTTCCADRSMLALLFAYQEYLVAFKLMKSPVVQRAQPLRMCICTFGSQRVKEDQYTR